MLLAPRKYEVEYWGQTVQSASETSASSTEYFPLGQSAQGAVPLTSLYWPGSHAVQLPPLGPVYPKLHTHKAMSEEATGESEAKGQEIQVLSEVAFDAAEYFPRSQNVQLDEPLMDFQVPGRHAEHSTPLGPVYPGSQMHWIISEDALADDANRGHCVHGTEPLVSL